MGSFTNSEDPDEMQHNAAFHQGLQSSLLVKVKISSEKRIQFFFSNYNLITLDMYNGLTQVYYIKLEGRIH